jgi:hypothetical protein
MSARLRLLGFGMSSLLVYGGIAWLSHAFVYGQGHRQRPIFPFVGLYAGAFVLYLLSLRGLAWLPRQRLDGLLVLGFAVLFRVALLFSNPIQEDDFYRYLWDGKVVASGLNPYSVAPLAVREQTGEDEGIQRYARIPAQDARFALILTRINHPEVSTIYPPLAQTVFALTALVAPGSLVALRLVFLGFDLGICGLVLAVLKYLDASRVPGARFVLRQACPERSRRAQYERLLPDPVTLSLSKGAGPLLVFVYAWSPLVIKETINSAHYDGVPTFFLILALLLALKRTTLLAHASLALAILGKVYPLLLLPVFLWRAWITEGRTRAFLGLGVVVAIVAFGYAPFLDAGPLLWQGTLAFAERWQTNSLIFPLLHALIGERWVTNTAIALVLGGTVLTVLRRYDMGEERTFLWANFLILGTLFLLSPVGNPWYFLWLVPFLCLFPFRSWLLLSGLLGLYYLSFYFIYRGTAETFRWVVGLEYLPFYGMLVWEWYATRRVDEPAPSTKP